MSNFFKIMAKKYKKTFELLNKEIQKHKTLHYNVLKLLCLYHTQEHEEFDRIFVEVTNAIQSNPRDYLHTLPLITMIIKEIKYETKFTTMYEEIAKTTDDKQLLLPFFTLLSSSNEFKKMADVSKSLSAQLPQYDYISTICLYIMGKYTPARFIGTNV